MRCGVKTIIPMQFWAQYVLFDGSIIDEDNTIDAFSRKEALVTAKEFARDRFSGKKLKKILLYRVG